MIKLVSYVGDLLKPVLTLLVTAVLSALILAIVWPAADVWIESYMPAWSMLDPVIETVRSWLGIHQPEEDTPWWRFF